MAHSTEDQVIALAGVFQSAVLVDHLAKTGSVPQSNFEATIGSLMITDPKSTLDVYGDAYGIQMGLSTLINLLDRKNDKQKVDAVRYTLTLLYLEGKLNKDREMLNVMGRRIEQVKNQAQHFHNTHPTVISAFASLYTDTISTFPQRIQVVGEPRYLRVDENAEKIRAMLLAGIRAAVLWRQTGGKRRHLLTSRRRLTYAAKNLYQAVNS